MKKIGFITGNGKFPFIAAQEAREKGYGVYICAVKGETEESIKTLAHEIEWIKLGEIKKIVNFFKKNDVSDVCLAGKITKTSLFSGNVKPDFDMICVMASLRNRKDDTILAAICDYLEKKGLKVQDSTLFLQEALPEKGVLTKKRPTKDQEEDIKFGWELAKEISRLDIGQSVIVKNKAVLAVEAIEGTDEAIKRGGALGFGKAVVVKVAKPEQDMRFDVPTIGPTTIKSMQGVEAKVLAFEAGKTICIEKEELVSLADRNGIIVVGI